MQSMKTSIQNALTNLDIVARRALAPKTHQSLQVIVCGPPRSGTSFLTGLIAEMGYHTGPQHWLKGGDPNNKNGYFECLPLNLMSQTIMANAGVDFHRNPEMPPGWLEPAIGKHGSKIRRVVNAGRIQLYKDNRLLVLAELYAHLYPRAKWLFIERSLDSTYKSRFGFSVSREEWAAITSARVDAWCRTSVSGKALNLEYEAFREDLAAQVYIIADFLQTTLSEQQLNKCLSLFQPTSN